MYYIPPFAFNFIEWLRDNVLQPIIEIFATIIVNLFITQLQIMFSFYAKRLFNLVFLGYVALLKVVDVMQSAFGLLSGSEKLQYTIGSETGTDYLTNVLLRVPQIKTVFWSIWLMSIVLCVVFLIAAVIRSISHLDDTGQSVGDVLRQTAGTLLLFFVIQVVAYCTLNLSNIVITSSQKAMNYASDTTEEIRLSNAIFASSAIGAGRTNTAADDPFSISSIINSTLNRLKGQSTPIFNMSWEKVKKYYTGDCKYYDLITVYKDFTIYKIDYLTAAICIVFVLKYMVGAALALVQRVVSIVVAYVTAPFFVAVAPLDGGERFNRWKDFFIGTCFSAVGTLMSVKIYLIVLPIFIRSDVIYTGSNSFLGYLIRLYSVVIISIGFEKLGDIVNKIISDAGIMGPSEAFGTITAFVDNIKSLGGIVK